MEVAPPADNNFVSWLASLGTGRPGFMRRRNSEYPSILQTGDVRVVFQPIVNLASGEIFAYETLVRSNSPLYRDPMTLISDAIEGQVCGALGRRIRELAIEGAPDHPLFLNIHPREFDESWLVQPDDPIFAHPHPIYLEITEAVPLSHFALCHSVLREVRSKGILLAIDDFGAGYSNVKYIADLSPEIVKLDRELVSNLGRGGRLKQLVRNLVKLCRDMGAAVVAEGVEHESEAEAAFECGATYGQGWYFARPAHPPPTVTIPARRR